MRVVAPDVGGGFGGKLPGDAREMIAFLAAKRLGKPVKYTESRSDSLLSAHHGRDVIQDIEIAATREGKLLGLKVSLIANMGAYLGLVTPGVPILGAFMYNAIYKVPAYRFECVGVFTNTMYTDAYRGAGRPEATYAIERIMDELAVELNLDPIEVRRRNWIQHDGVPVHHVCGLEYDSGNYEAATAKALDMLGYDELRREQERRRQENDPVQIGIGTSTYTEMCGLAPSRVLGSLRYGAGGWESASVRMLPTGKVEVVTGSSAHGQGHETAWSQIVADSLGVPFDDVEVLHGDTRTVAQGHGHLRVALAGRRRHRAVQRLQQGGRQGQADRRAHARMRPGRPGVQRRAVQGARHARARASRSRRSRSAVFAAHDLPDGIEPTLDADATYDPVNFSFPHGTHLCAVEVDTQTGRVTIRKYVAVDDIGRVVNPLIVEGQVHGGIAQGVAQALFEEAIYDADGNLVTGTFVDYTLPSAADLPDFSTDRTRRPRRAIRWARRVSARRARSPRRPPWSTPVVDALRPFGVNDVPMPCTPERVWRAIQEGGAK
jgi:carbon-monoxide dehydrogenase large subunit